MIDIDELNRIHEDTVYNIGLAFQERWQIAIGKSWPDLYRELTDSRKRLAILEEFARRVRWADKSDIVPTAEMRLSEAVAWLDAATKKAGV